MVEERAGNNMSDGMCVRLIILKLKEVKEGVIYTRTWIWDGG